MQKESNTISEKYICRYCQKEFGSSINSLHAHLQFCKKRELKRYLKYSGKKDGVTRTLLFIIFVNPKRKLFSSIIDFVELSPAPSLAVISGALEMLRIKGDIKKVGYVEIKTSKRVIEYDNGFIGLHRLERLLMPSEYNAVFGLKKTI